MCLDLMTRGCLDNVLVLVLTKGTEVSGCTPSVWVGGREIEFACPPNHFQHVADEILAKESPGGERFSAACLHVPFR